MIFFRRILIVLLLLSLLPIAAVCSEQADLPPVDLDLTGTGGNLLIDQLSEIQFDPASWAGKILRVRGQYYLDQSEDSPRHMLIVSDCATYCSEVGLLMVPAEGAGLLWPEASQEIEVVARVESYQTSWGDRSCLSVLSVR